MSLADQILAVNDTLPIRTALPVHNGKVRAVYWLTKEDSKRLIKEKDYPVPEETALGIMVISDRISAFDCIWHGEEELKGVPGKGAALNAISHHWFALFKEKNLAQSHILDVPHPLVWIVQKAQPLKIEAVCRQYITGSLWRAYEKGERRFCGISLPEGLTQNSPFPSPLITPSTKGILKGIQGVPEADDVNIERKNIEDHYAAFGFKNVQDIEQYETLLKDGVEVIREALDKKGQIFVDTKFEFGYVKDQKGQDTLIYMDEVGTPDSSRIWDKSEYEKGQIVENSKEGFRQFLLQHFKDPDILLNKDRMPEREALAQEHALPVETLLDISRTYLNIAEKITGKKITLSQNPKEEIIRVLKNEYALID